MRKSLLLLLATLLGTIHCLLAQTYPPSCVVTMPYNNAYFKAGTDVEIHVYSTDIGKTMNNGTVTKVEFFNGTTKLGEASTHANNTYRYVWSCVPAGTYTIKARATNNRGVTFTSVGVIITVGTNNVTQRGLSACKGKYMASLHQGQLLGNFAQYFNGVSAENSCKWGSVENNRDNMNWSGADAAYNAAMNNNMMFRYHAALWAAQYPSWLFTLNTTDARAELVEYMQGIAARFPKTDQIDVLNEQLFNHQRDNQRMRDLFSGKTNTAVTDFSWQIWLFEQARAIFPNTKLVLNDYGLEGNTNDINEMLKLVRALRDRGLIDGFGTQAHCFNVDARPAGRITQDVTLMATGGVPVYVTELDMNGGNENYASNEQAQRNSFATHFPEYWEHPAVKGVTWWGHMVNRTWIGGTGFITEAGQDRAAMTWLKSYLAARTNVGYPICATGACTNPGEAPTVSLTAPANNSSYTTLQTITLSATATDTDGKIAKVDFYNGTTLIASDTTAPYTYSWTGAIPGTHTLTALAMDNSGLSKTSSPVTVTVTAAQAPFKGQPHAIPGVIQAEDYDLGGEGVAFHENNTQGNQGGATYRNDQVDIETTQDATGTYNVGYALDGEWLEYTVNVSGTDFYDIRARVASQGAGKTMHIEIDGVDVTDAITVPNTAGWQTWATVSVNAVKLSAGAHTMRVVFDADYINFNYLDIIVSPIILGMDNEVLSTFSLYPNPFAHNIQVRSAVPFAYQLMNIEGQVLEEGTSEGNAELGANHPKGVYMLKINQGNSSRVVKLVKE